jgi:hypothetical protein
MKIRLPALAMGPVPLLLLLVSTTATGCGGEARPALTIDAGAASVHDGAVDVPESAAPPTEAGAPLELTGTVPSEVAVADLVTLYGKGFRPDTTLEVEGTSVVPTLLSPEVLTFVMPQVTASGCRRELPLTLRSDGRVAERAIVLVSRGPSVAPVKTPVRAGERVELTGTELSRAQAHLSERQLLVAALGPSRIDVTIPRDVVPGPASLRVGDECGAVQVALQILAPVPRLTSVEPMTLAPGGVAYVLADTSGRDVVAAYVGARRIAPGAADLTWFQTGGRDVLAVRMPRDLAPGPVDILLEGATGMSEPFRVTGVTAPASTPPSPEKIVLAPDIVSGDTFPIVTTGNSIATELGPTEPFSGAWNYSFGTRPTDDSCLTGEFTISEFGVSETDAGLMRIFGSMDGTYSVKDRENRVELVARRRVELDDGGTKIELEPEAYSGGVLSMDGGVPQAAPCTRRIGGFGPFTSTYMVLRSKSTGRQLVFKHGVIAQCPLQPVRVTECEP